MGTVGEGEKSPKAQLAQGERGKGEGVRSEVSRRAIEVREETRVVVTSRAVRLALRRSRRQT